MVHSMPVTLSSKMLIKAKVKKIILNDNILVICNVIELRFYLLIYFQPLKFRITDYKLEMVVIYSKKYVSNYLYKHI